MTLIDQPTSDNRPEHSNRAVGEIDPGRQNYHRLTDRQRSDDYALLNDQRKVSGGQESMRAK